MGKEQGAFRYGAVDFPLTSDTTNSLLQDADPALFRAIDFLSTMIRTYVGDRLITAAQLQGLNLPSAVVTTAPIEPEPYLLGDQFQLPLFALYRVKDVWDYQTVVWDRSSAVWEYSYLLPAMTPVQAKALAPILRAVAMTLRRSIHMGSDPNYNGGEQVWANAGIHHARLVESVYGAWEKVDKVDKYFRAVTGTIAVMERELPIPEEYSDFAGADVGVDYRAPDGTIITPFVELGPYERPTLTSVSPTSGSADGGDTVTLTGTGFRVGTRPIVLFDGSSADAVTVVDAQTATCRSPKHYAYPSFVSDVIYIAADAQTATLEGGFTFNA